MGYQGIDRQMSYEKMHRYTAEFQHSHDVRPLDTVDQMAKGMDYMRQTYACLIENGIHTKRGMETAA